MLQTLLGRVRPVFTAQAQPLKQKRTELTLHSPPQYRTPQGSAKSLLTHILKQHLTEEGPGDAVAPEDARIFLATKSAAEFAPEQVYQEFKAKQDQTGGHEFDNISTQHSSLARHWTATLSGGRIQGVAMCLRRVLVRRTGKPGVLGFAPVLETFGCMEAAESLADHGG
jgi:hypothetical protein